MKTASACTPPVLEKELFDTIKTAAEAVQGAKIFGELPFESLKVQIQYGFRQTYRGGVGAVFELATIGINAQHDKNSVQTVTLTFAKL